VVQVQPELAIIEEVAVAAQEQLELQATQELVYLAPAE
jgi:hypothetical protein